MTLSTIDLFCGAGGLTEGFAAAGFRCLFANDFDAHAVATFRANHPGTWCAGGQIQDIDPQDVRRRIGIERGELDVLVGGPPCQGFSINAPARALSDPRNALVAHYLRFVEEFAPRTLLIENVPGMLSLGGGAVFEGMLAALQRAGYRAGARILFAAHYGVPQERWRTIVLAGRDGVPAHPLPTHAAVGRANFRGGRELTFRPGPEERAALAGPVSVADAIGDLPRLRAGEGTEEASYRRPAHSAYASALRAGSGTLTHHVASGLSPQNLERLRHIPPGGSWRDIPHDLLPAGMQRARRSDHTRRYGRLRADGLAGTVMTKCDPHWGPVFLPDQDRSLTVREAARLQSFPDRYRFSGSRTEQYRQVGNAVPPLLAAAIAGAIRDHLQAAPLRRAA